MDNQSPLDISELINSLKITQRGPNEQLAKNVVMTLAAKILEAQFGSELAFVGRPGKATMGTPGDSANATYTRGTGNISVTPTANNNSQTMYMAKQQDGSYLGNFHGNPTTEDVLDMVETLRHEIYHARTDQKGSIVDGYPTNKLSKDSTRRNMLIDTISKRELPSVGSATFPLDEFLATAVPLSNAESKLGPLTRQQKRFKEEIDMVIHNYPEVAKLIGDMSRPELLTK